MVNPGNSAAASPPHGLCSVVMRAPGTRLDAGGLSLAAALLGALLLGCGARAAVDGSPDDGDELGAAGVGGSGAAGRGGSPGGAGGTASVPIDPSTPIDVGGVTLPECVLGSPLSSAGSRGCSFIAAGNCYDDREMACACACRGLADTRCIIGGFLNPEEPQTVRCTAR